jgi:signal transduction histidine kinase
MHSLPITLLISLFITLVMIFISSMMYFSDRDRRNGEVLEYWISNGSYFLVTFLCNQNSEYIVALPTLFWVWRARTIKNILRSVCHTTKEYSWYGWLFALSFLVAILFAFSGFSFAWYTFPQAVAYFVIIMHAIVVGIRGMNKITINHKFLFFCAFLIVLHTLNFSFLRLNPQYSTLGFAIVLTNNILMAIVLPSVTIFDLKTAQQAKLEKILQDREELLKDQAKLSSLGKMTASIAHDINNPLGVIIHRLHLVKTLLNKSEIDREALTRNLDHIQHSSEHISKIVRGLRNFTKGGSEPLEQVKVSTIIEETLSYCIDRFQMNGIKLIVEPSPDLEIECRASQISQVILNLLNNSFDAIVNTPQPWVKLRFMVDERVLKIIVTDSGHGIPDSIRNKMMEPFFTTKARAGTGLGLSISKGIMEDHHGRLYYDPSSNHTSFVMEFPYRQSST